ncbi:hypothetical protein SAY87_017593 [Trapa incisa]|uniref:Uncharacterized protein n=1 Tax=Trapa incisa TaxID=236973 RepID=A0AAN7QUA1_9MYRT|nr:hypothetical protein SAY87_017593 [Trapa incisa]
MSCLNRAWMAVGVTAVQGHTDRGVRLKSGLKSLQSDVRPVVGMVGSGIDGTVGNHRDGDDRRRQTDESLESVMYLSCWSQS